MPTLQPEVVAGVIVDLGVPRGTTVSEWVALAKRESSYDTDNEGPTDSDGDVPTGLWQVKHKIHAGTAGGPSDPEQYRAWLKNPYNNFNAAKAIYTRAGGWGPWEASHAPTAESNRAAQNPNRPAARALLAYEVTSDLGGGVELPGWVSDPLELVAEPLRALVDAIREGIQVIVDAGKWITDTHNLERIGFVLGGAVVAIGGAYIIARPTVEPVVKDAKSIATKGLA